MPRFSVEVIRTYSIVHEIEVEADTEDEAVALAEAEALEIPYDLNDLYEGDMLIGMVVNLDDEEDN